MADQTASGLLLLAPHGLLRGLRGDGGRLLQVEQPDLDRPPPEDLLAQQGVDVDADQLGLFEGRRGGPPGLVVDDHQLAVGGEVESVDDASQAHVADPGLEEELDPRPG